MSAPRRINNDLPGHDPKARVKQIAGLIQNLPFREMSQLGHEIHNAIDDLNVESVTEGILSWAEEKTK